MYSRTFSGRPLLVPAASPRPKRGAAQRWRCPALAAWLAALLLLAACGGAEPTPAPTPTAVPPTATPAARQGLLIVAMGDSLTEGLGVDSAEAYPAQLQRKLQENGYDVTVVNAGVSGETSSGARSRTDWVLRQKPDIVILATGGNDGLRGIDPAITQENIDQIVQSIQASGAVVVLAGMEMVQNMGTQFTSDFRAIYPEIAQRHNLILMPFLLEGVAANPDLNQPDFIHPTAEGYTIVVDNLYPYVVQAIEQVQGAQ
jgi:acyl-CoA thioesterase-1